MFLRTKKIHFVGIGGAGMCPLAEVMVRKGHSVSGSDQQMSASTKRLESLGVQIQYDHEPKFICDADILVYTSAVNAENRELIYAQSHKIITMKRAQMLGDLMKSQVSIGIAGTHGKTTTTSLIGRIFEFAKEDPTVIVGGAFKGSQSNAIIGNGKVLIAEADEYDRSFLKMFPTVAVITNIEADHLDIYTDLDDIADAFVDYIGSIPFYGMVVLCNDDSGVKTICDRIDKTVISYGISEISDYMADSIVYKDNQTQFDVIYKGTKLGVVSVPLMGDHNVRNTLAAIAVAIEMKIPFETIQKSLVEYVGIKRRFEIIGTEKDITVVDDYAHHPTEIEATLEAAKNAGFGRVVAIFQPHLYSRTRDFEDDFAKSLCHADIAFVTDIYKAREEPIAGVTSENIVAKIKKSGFADVEYIDNLDTLVEMVVPKLKAQDGVILMGAGNIWESGLKLLEGIKNE